MGHCRRWAKTTPRAQASAPTNVAPGQDAYTTIVGIASKKLHRQLQKHHNLETNRGLQIDACKKEATPKGSTTTARYELIYGNHLEQQEGYGGSHNGVFKKKAAPMGIATDGPTKVVLVLTPTRKSIS
jgi:hypothetical protein